MSKATHLRNAARLHAKVLDDSDLRGRDAEILAARRDGATWKEVTDKVGCSLRTAQNAVQRALGSDARY